MHFHVNITNKFIYITFIKREKYYIIYLEESENMNNFFIRIEQFVCAMYTKTLKEPIQELYVGNNSLFNLVKVAKKNKISKVFIVSDKTIAKLNLISLFVNLLKANNIDYFVFDEVESDPSIETVEKGFKLYSNNSCDSIIAFGGGSVLDCAKVIGARISNPNKSIFKLKRLIGGVKKFNVPFFAIPTTSGTGSENTFFALITNRKTKEKYPLFSNKYVPSHVALDANLTVNLPLNITAYTAMDALTHAIEAYISPNSKYFKKDKKEGLEAIKIILNNIEKVYAEPTNLKYRENMAIASYKAGIAFRRINIGYVHNFAHRMGEFYHIPHGLANAIILPFILEFSFPKSKKSLSEIALYCGLGNENESSVVLANNLINKIKELKEMMKIPSNIREIKEEDYNLLVKRILKESYMCGNPRLMNKSQCKNILNKIKGVSREK